MVVDTGGMETTQDWAVWTSLDARGPGLEIYGPEGWGFESLGACC